MTDFSVKEKSEWSEVRSDVGNPNRRDIRAAGVTRKKVVATASRQRARLQANRRAERAFLRKRRNDEAYD